jgi:hypothetical protein
VLAARGTETESLDDMEPIYPFMNERTDKSSVSNRSACWPRHGEDSVTCDKLVHHFA